MSRATQRGLVALLVGALFGVGLAIGGMTDPRKVIGFLDIAGAWDPTLAFVMVGAIGVHALSYRLIMRRKHPLLADEFAIPSARAVDSKLVGGAALFGVGWGLGGYCPGPAIVSLGTGGSGVIVFVVAMIAGMLISDRRIVPGTPGRQVLFHDTVTGMRAVKKATTRRTKAPTTRLQKHRADMRRRGFKLVQLWVPDPTAPGFADAVRKTRQFLETHPDAEWDEFAQRVLDDAPEWSER